MGSGTSFDSREPCRGDREIIVHLFLTHLASLFYPHNSMRRKGRHKTSTKWNSRFDAILIQSYFIEWFGWILFWCVKPRFLV